MGCIEIIDTNLKPYKKYWINRNMGCIEIGTKHNLIPVVSRLIETWDVLKLVSSPVGSLSDNGLIETWDVLKSYRFKLLCLHVGD